jgi:hypothetical protein
MILFTWEIEMDKPESSRPDFDRGARVAASYPARPTRFPIETAFQFRQSGEPEWHEGTTINISRSGVLFRADAELSLQTILEMRITFPAALSGENPTQVVCWGPVVRTEYGPEGNSRPRIAASIFRYRFDHA